MAGNRQSRKDEVYAAVKNAACDNILLKTDSYFRHYKDNRIPVSKTKVTFVDCFIT